MSFLCKRPGRAWFGVEVVPLSPIEGVWGSSPSPMKPLLAYLLKVRFWLRAIHTTRAGQAGVSCWVCASWVYMGTQYTAEVYLGAAGAC